MKNYGHTWQWGKNPEYIIDVGTRWNWWALPLSIGWSRFEIQYDRCFSIAIRFLCFKFSIDIWRWNK